jgi:Fe-S-cluster containining protein
MFSVDRDRPTTWKKYTDGLCKNCIASCCMLPVEVKASDLIRLKLTTADEINNSIKKTAKRLKKSGYISSYREGTEFFMLTQKSNDDCIFLDTKIRNCTVYELRPDTCRGFPSTLGPRISYCPVIQK